MMKKIFPALAIFFAVVGVAKAIPLIDEPFNVSGTMTVSPYDDWSSVSGTGTQLTVGVTDGLAMGVSDRDYSRTYAAQSGFVYYGFDLNVASLPNNASEYFVAFADGSGFDGRIWMSTSSDGNNWGLGLSIASNTIGDATALTFALNTTYRVVAGYNPTSDAISLWIGSYSQGSPTISTTGTDPSTSTDNIVLRQGGALDNGASEINVQNLVVSTTFSDVVPEPTTCALFGAGALFWVLRRKRTA